MGGRAMTPDPEQPAVVTREECERLEMGFLDAQNARRLLASYRRAAELLRSSQDMIAMGEYEDAQAFLRAYEERTDR